MWTVILLHEVDEWFIALDSDTSESVADAIDELESKGPLLGRPLADRIKGSKLHNLKELRPPPQTSASCSSSTRCAKPSYLSLATRPVNGRSGTPTTSRKPNGDIRTG